MLLISLLGLTFGSSVFLNEIILCPEDFKGDSICDLGCMKTESNFDSAKLLQNPADMMLRSDCYNNCTSMGCTIDLLSNDICDDECNNIFCGWDAGTCGYCNSDCTLDLLNNNHPDDECNTKYCLYDNGEFGYCAPGCFYSDFISNDINLACNVSDCFYQNLIGLYNYTPDTCNLVLLENGICDEICDNEEFEYDNGDCLCAPGCLPEMLEAGNCSLDNPCANYNCNFVGGKCLKCDDACFVSNIGDGTCQSECNTEKCNYDGGDCGCAPGCNSTYKNGEWNMVGDCEIGCLVPSCLFNYKVCDDLDLLSVALMYSFVFETYNNPLEIKDEENCPLDTLKSFSKDDNFETSSFCYNPNCLYCGGFVQNTLTDCERFGNNRCFIYSSSNYFTIFGYPVDIIHPLINISTTVPKINELMNGLIYFVKEGSFAKHSPNIITVSDKLSFYEAMYINLSPYTIIQLGEGTFPLNFTDNSYIYLDYLMDFSSPLKKLFEYQFYELTIKGIGIENTVVEFLDNIAIEVDYKILYLQNINFTGAFLLDKYCDKPTCYYCPYYSITNSKVWVNDRDEIIEDSSKYALNCGKDSRTQFLFENDAFISNVVFHNFQNQAPHLIISYGTLSFTDVIFEKIQQEESSPTIIQVCKLSNCFYKTLTFENVQVLDLNYGYEHIETTHQSYFLSTSQIGDILFKNFNFEYGMSIPCMDCTSIAVFVFESIEGTIQILDSEFKNLYINKLIEIKTDSLIYSSEATAQIEKGKQKISSMNHLFINNTKFLNIYAQEGLIFHNMNSFKQNVRISYCQFKQIVSLNIAFFQAPSIEIISESEAIGTYAYNILENGRSIIKISPRIIHFFELDIEDIRSGNLIIDLYNMPNVKLEEVRFNNLKSISENDTYNYVINKFVEGGKYLSIKPENPLIHNLNFYSIFICYPTNTVIITGLSVINIESDLYTFTLIYTEQCYSLLEITNVYMSNIYTSTYSASLFYFSFISYFTASNLTFDEISNEYFSIINLVNIDSLSIVNVSLSNIRTNLKAAVSLINMGSVFISNFEVISISSKASKGTLFDIFLAPIPIELYISNIFMINCTNENGRGLFIFLDTISPQSPFNLLIENVMITNSYTKDAFFHFDFNVNLNNSYIFNVNILNSVTFGSVISDYHNQGILSFENLAINYCKAGICGIKGVYILSNLLLTIFDSEIKNSVCSEYVLFIEGHENTSVFAQDLTIFNITCSYSPIIFALTSNLIFINAHFHSLIGESLIYSMLTNTEISDSVFEDISSVGFYLLFSNISCSNCVFKNFQGTVLRLSQSSNCFINSSVFQEINSKEESFLYSSKSDYLSFSNCKFQYSNSKKSNFYIEDSYMNFLSCTVNDNGSKKANLISLSNSTLSIYDSIFFNQHYQFIDSELGDVDIENSNFFQNITNIVEITGNLTKNREALNEILSESIESGIKVYFSKLRIRSSSFNDFLAVVIDSEHSDVDISDSSFIGCATSELNSGIIHSKNSDLFQVYKSYFNSSLTETGFIKIQQINVVKIFNSNFENNVNDNGSGLYIEGSGEGKGYAIVDSCYFYNNNVSGNGGGIYSSGVNLNISSSIFEFNKADKKGGGIYFDVGSCKICKLRLYGNNSFISNSSPNGSGGAIKWLGTPPEIYGNNFYLNNSALYGSDNAAYPVKLKFDTKRELFGIDNFKPGTTFKEIFRVCLADDYNNVVNSPEFDGIQGVLGSVDNFIVSGKTSFESYFGCFDLTNFSISGEIGKIGSISFYSKYIEDTSNNYGLYDSQENATLTISITLRNCSFGEQNLNTQCTSCKALKYLIYSDDSCLDCPTGAECLGGFMILPKKGYWKLDRYSDQIYKCPIEEACLGSKNISDEFNDFISIDDDSIDYSGTCLTGYNGKLCGTCEIGYSKSGKGECSKCPNPTLNTLIIIVFTLLIVLIAYIMVSTTLKSAFSLKSLHSVYFKIFTNYLQIIFLTTEFNMNWPSYVLELFSIQRSAASVSNQLYSIDCYFNEGSSNTIEEIYSYKVVLIVLLPIIISLISFSIWVFISFYKENSSYLKQEVWTTIIVLFFLVHPNIVKTIFSSFSCMEIERSGYWLNENLGIRCWGAFHKKIILTVTLPGAIIWVFGFPLTVLLIMAKRYRHLGRDQNKVIFGFIYNGYKRRKFYWEFVILFRKILIISVSVFMIGASIAVQALTVVILLLAALYLQFSKHPYNHKQLNFMETQALFTATITIYCGLYYITTGLNEFLKTGLFVVIVLGNLYFIIFWIYYMFKAIGDILIRFFPKLKKCLKKGDYFQKEIFEESLQIRGVYVDKTDSKKNFTLFDPVYSVLERNLEGVRDMRSLYIANMKYKSEIDERGFD